MTPLPAAGYAVMFILSTVPAYPADDAPLSFDQLMAMLHTVQHVDARYVEHRTLHILRTPIETRGTLRFDAPDHLEKTTDSTLNAPADRLTIDGNQLIIDRGPEKPPVTLMLNEHPEVAVLIESIRSTLSGDATTLRRAFNITLAGNSRNWQIVLQPHDPAQRQLLQWMRINGAGPRVIAIDTQNTNGDHSEMTIEDAAP
jgi:hypothetical protein